MQSSRQFTVLQWDADSSTTSASRRNLAILSTHPIQYHAHWFRALAAQPALDLHVFYCYHASPVDQARAGFGVEFEWDLPLLEGYRHTFLNADREKRRNFFSLSAPQIAQIIQRGNFDAVMVNGWHYRATWQAIFACWKHQIPVMVRGDSQLASPRSQLKRFLKYPLYRSFIPRFDGCLAVGSRSRDYFLHYGARPERIFMAPHAIADELFRSAAEGAESRRPPLRRQWMCRDGACCSSARFRPEEQTVFLFAGKFIAKKRPMDFLRALEAACYQQPGVAGLMVGDGPLRATCERWASSRKLPVHFTGFLNQSRMVDAYAASDCLVLPSEWESWGIVVNEAMSCSRPAVVSDAVGCAPDLVHNGRTGAIFPLGDVGALAKIMVGFATYPERLRAMGECARAGLRSYSLGAAVQGVLDAVEAVTLNKREAHG